MCELFAMSARYPTSVHFSMNIFSQHGGYTGPHKDGWGVAYYAGKEAWQLKAPESAAYSSTLNFIEHHAPASKVMMSHIRLATHGDISLENTQPFSVLHEGARLTFAHNGHVPALMETPIAASYQPLGSTDSEWLFGLILAEFNKLKGLPDDQKFNALEKTLSEFAEAGPMNIVFTDGRLVFAFSNRRTQSDKTIRAPGMVYLCRTCSSKRESEMSGVTIAGEQQELILFASVALSSEEAWQPMEPNKLYIARDGEFIRS